MAWSIAGSVIPKLGDVVRFIGRKTEWRVAGVCDLEILLEDTVSMFWVPIQEIEVKEKTNG